VAQIQRRDRHSTEGQMKFHIYKDRNKHWRWRLLARNGRKIANSGEGYVRRKDCMKIISRIRTHSMFAPVEDLTRRAEA
jgi:uncharacterized protein YegP (UPF0339 family)